MKKRNLQLFAATADVLKIDIEVFNAEVRIVSTSEPRLCMEYSAGLRPAIEEREGAVVLRQGKTLFYRLKHPSLTVHVPECLVPDINITAERGKVTISGGIFGDACVKGKNIHARIDGAAFENLQLKADELDMTADEITVKLWKDGSASVRDNGRGMPTDINKKAGISGVELIFTKLHAGGKFDEGNYAFSGGLHGVGASVTNALSRWLEVEVCRGKVYTMRFSSSYDAKNKKWLCGVPEGPLKDTGAKAGVRGTFVRFMPDDRVFETVEWNYDTISKRLKELAFLNKGVRINFEDERVLYRTTAGEDGEDVKEKLPAREAVSYNTTAALWTS